MLYFCNICNAGVINPEDGAFNAILIHKCDNGEIEQTFDFLLAMAILVCYHGIEQSVRQLYLMYKIGRAHV